MTLNGLEIFYKVASPLKPYFTFYNEHLENHFSNCMNFCMTFEHPLLKALILLLNNDCFFI